MDLSLKYLTNLCQFPRVNVECYFKLLRNTLDSAEIEYNYDEEKVINNKVSGLKKYCLEFLEYEEFKEELSEIKSFIDSNPTSNDLIRKQIKIFENSIFLNQSILLFIKERCRDTDLFHENNLCRLIIVTNYHFNQDIEIVLKNNKFNKQNEITNELLRLEHLRKLIIDSKREDLFQQDEFDLNIDQVKELSLNNRNISKIDSFSFEGFNNLEILNLEHNNLTNIPSNLFQNLINLTEIDLSSNSISRIEKETFKNLTKLTFINLASNDLFELDEEVFSNLNYLDTLVLSNNPISDRYNFNGQYYLIIWD